MPTGREAILDAFGRLFDVAAAKLGVAVSPTERTEAKDQFAERFASALELCDHAETPAFPPEVLSELEAQIGRVSPVELAGVLASMPLVRQVQEMLGALAYQQAQQKMLEHLAMQADTQYGGN
jgi:hypothetical protein